MHDLENHPMTRMSPGRSFPVWIAAVATAMLMVGCDSSPEAHPTWLNSKVDAGTMALSRQPVLYLQDDIEVTIYADGRVIWPIGDGDPGYLQMRLTPEAVEWLRSSAVSTGLFEQDQGLTLDHRPGRMEVRRDDRSVILAWGKNPSATQSWANAVVDLEKASAATAEQETEVIGLVGFFRDPTAWMLPRRMYVQPETSPFVPSRLVVVYDGGVPDWSKVPSPVRKVVSANLQRLIRDGCQVISTDQAREIARALTQAGFDADYDSQRGLLGFQAAGSFVHASPALPHEVACKTRWPGGA